jgi:hypothetical protein
VGRDGTRENGEVLQKGAVRRVLRSQVRSKGFMWAERRPRRDGDRCLGTRCGVAEERVGDRRICILVSSENEIA